MTQRSWLGTSWAQGTPHPTPYWTLVTSLEPWTIKDRLVTCYWFMNQNMKFANMHANMFGPSWYYWFFALPLWPLCILEFIRSISHWVLRARANEFQILFKSSESLRPPLHVWNSRNFNKITWTTHFLKRIFLLDFDSWPKIFSKCSKDGSGGKAAF